MNSITLTYFKDNLLEVIKKVRQGNSVLIRDNDQPVLKLSSVEPDIDSPRIVTSREEMKKAEMELRKALEEGKLSWHDCSLATIEPVHMGATDSSNLDKELYK